VELERLIRLTSPKSIITLKSLELRLRNVREELEQEKLKSTTHHVCGTISFRGLPVFESTGINAAFAADAIKGFEKVIAAKSSSFSNPLSSTGRIPDHDKFHLMITGTIAGSFGFELKEFIDQNNKNDLQQKFQEGDLSPLSIESAIENTIDFLETVRSGTDEELADIVADTDDRVIKETRDFLEILSKWDAMCELEFGNYAFAFINSQESRMGFERLKTDNIDEGEESIVGTFLGVLPYDRTFEFRCRDSNQVIKGKIDSCISDPGVINHHLEKNVTIIVHRTQLGKSKPKYKLRSYVTH
jgi:hypothetical protein